MGEIYLVRHGQASFGAENYDQLSDLGYQQSRWLGEYFRERDIQFDRVVRGGMQRHRQTADSILEAMGGGPQAEEHEGYNEFDFQRVLNAYLHHDPDYPVPDRSDVRAIYRMLRRAMAAWANDELVHELPETWQQFHDRVADALRHTTNGGERGRKILVVSSGGAISMSLKQIMQFETETLINLNLQARNTGINHLYFGADTTYVTSFNHVPHLDRPDRLDAITHY